MAPPAVQQLEITRTAFADLGRIAREIYLFQDASVGEIERLCARIQLYRFADKTRIIKQGGPGDSFFVLYKGHCQVVVRRGMFKGSTEVARLGPGDVFGEMAIVLGAPRSADVIASGAVEAFVISRDIFESIHAENPTFAEAIVRLVRHRRQNTNFITAY